MSALDPSTPRFLGGLKRIEVSIVASGLDRWQAHEFTAAVGLLHLSIVEQS